MAMECIQCQNCKSGQSMYYCAARDEFVIDNSRMAVVEKTRSGWKRATQNMRCTEERIAKN